MYCLEKFQNHESIDGIIIVAATEWYGRIQQWIEDTNIKKFMGFASAGISRQHSIYQGLNHAKSCGAKEEDIVIIHDAARACVSDEIISACIDGISEADGVMPVIEVKDTVYFSKSGKEVESLLDRDCLYAGQAPESFRFGKYYMLHEKLNDSELGSIRGSSEIAYKNGLKVKLISGSEENYKITTMSDLEKFRMQLEGK